MPHWYPLVAASRYLGVSPFELQEKSLAWVHRALAAQSAEHHAQEMHSKMDK